MCTWCSFKGETVSTTHNSKAHAFQGHSHHLTPSCISCTSFPEKLSFSKKGIHFHSHSLTPFILMLKFCLRQLKYHVLLSLLESINLFLSTPGISRVSVCICITHTTAPPCGLSASHGQDFYIHLCLPARPKKCVLLLPSLSPKAGVVWRACGGCCRAFSLMQCDHKASHVGMMNCCSNLIRTDAT